MGVNTCDRTFWCGQAQPKAAQQAAVQPITAISARALAATKPTACHPADYLLSSHHRCINTVDVCKVPLPWPFTQQIPSKPRRTRYTTHTDPQQHACVCVSRLTCRAAVTHATETLRPGQGRHRPLRYTQRGIPLLENNMHIYMVQNWVTATPTQHVGPVSSTSCQKVEASHMRKSGTHAMAPMTRDAAKNAQHHAAPAVPPSQ